MKNERWLDAIGSCIVVAGGAAFAALIYQAYILAVPAMEAFLAPRNFMSIGW